jgi:hypothetical protein
VPLIPTPNGDQVAPFHAATHGAAAPPIALKLPEANSTGPEGVFAGSSQSTKYPEKMPVPPHDSQWGWQGWARSEVVQPSTAAA